MRRRGYLYFEDEPGRRAAAEGLDTLDLKEAKKLLDELAA